MVAESAISRMFKNVAAALNEGGDQQLQCGGKLGLMGSTVRTTMEAKKGKVESQRGQTFRLQVHEWTSPFASPPAT